MPDALTYLSTKFDLNLTYKSPIEIPNTNRRTLAHLFSLLGFRRGAEVGVEQGEYSEVLCEEIPGLRLYAVDPWKSYRGYRDHVDQGKLDQFYTATRHRLGRFPRVEIVRDFSVRAAAKMPDEWLDFVYLDANHAFEHLTADLAAWTPKVKVGGIIAGHDYVRYKLPNRIHVMQVVHAWTDAYEIAPWFVLGAHEKREGELRDTSRSWFWVKPAWVSAKRKLKQ